MSKKAITIVSVVVVIIVIVIGIGISIAKADGTRVSHSVPAERFVVASVGDAVVNHSQRGVVPVEGRLTVGVDTSLVATVRVEAMPAVVRDGEEPNLDVV